MPFETPTHNSSQPSSAARAEDDGEEELSVLSHQPRMPDESASDRRRRDVRAARDRLSEQYDQLRRVLPDPPAGVELTPKAAVLEYTLKVINDLMARAAELALELAVVTPEATRRWVRNCADDGRKPLVTAVSSVMKMFAARRGWRYAEWWTLDERKVQAEEMNDGNGRGVEDENGRLVGVLEEPRNVHGCVVRDSVSVMRLGWTLIHRATGVQGEGTEEDEALAEFARRSRGFQFEPRVGMPGRVWTSRRTEWLIDLADRETFIRSPLAAQFGMKTCLGVPIQFGGHVHSVMAFYSREVRAYNTECHDLAILLSKCIEEVYSPGSGGPWQVNTESLFPASHGLIN